MPEMGRNDLLDNLCHRGTVQPERHLMAQSAGPRRKRSVIGPARAFAGDDENQPQPPAVARHDEPRQFRTGLVQGQTVQIEPRLGPQFSPGHLLVSPVIHAHRTSRKLF